jgi:hypothetical protein
MSISKSTILKHLSKIESDTINHEWTSINEGWDSHAKSRNIFYNSSGPLRHGKTLWIYKVDNLIRCVENRWNQISKTYEIIKYLYEEYQYCINKKNGIGRAYIHRLEPGQSIDRHDDRKMQFVTNVLHRYQLFLNIPTGFEIFMDNRYHNSSDYSNTIIDFNLRLPHEYNNNSNQTVMFMVFDVMKPDFSVKTSSPI